MLCSLCWFEESNAMRLNRLNLFQNIEQHKAEGGPNRAQKPHFDFQINLNQKQNLPSTQGSAWEVLEERRLFTYYDDVAATHGIDVYSRDVEIMRCRQLEITML